MIKKWVIILTLWALLLNLASFPTHAQEAPDCELDVIVQRDDWLSKLSEKFYGEVLAFPAIAEATNAKTVVDPTYAFIENVDLIEPGWKLCIVNVSRAEEILGFELDAAPTANTTPENLAGPIKIGAAHALSGPLVEQGQSIRNGIDLAVKEINDTQFLGEGVLQVIWEDTAGDKDQAVRAFTKLINEDQVVAILGPTLSKSAFAADPIAQVAGVPVIGSSNTAVGVTDIGDYIFRTNLLENVTIANTLGRLKDDLQLQRAAVIYNRSNTFTKSNQAAFAQALSEVEVETISTIAFTSGDSDFSARLAEIKSLNPDAIILNTLADEAATIMLQARQVGLPESVRFIGGNSINSPGFLALGGDIINGLIFGAAWNVDDISGANRQFVADYSAAYGRPPDQFAAQSYTAVKVLAAALRNADSLDRAAIRAALDTLEFVESPLGLFAFDDDRNATHPSVVQVVENGQFVIFQ